MKMSDIRLWKRCISVRIGVPMCAFLAIPFFKPNFISIQIPLVSFGFNVWFAISVGIIYALYFLRGQFSKFLFAVFIYESMLLISTVINKGYYYGAVKYFFLIPALCMLIELMVKQSPCKLIKVLMCILGIECIINSVTILLFPTGMYRTGEGLGNVTRNWFLGYDNGHILYILPLACFAWIYAAYRELKWRYKILGLIACFGTVYVTWSAASVISATVFMLMFFVSELHLRSRLLRFRNLILVIIMAFLGIVFFRIQNNFAYIIQVVLGKDLTLTGRTLVWDRALTVFKENPIIGIGIKTRLYNSSLIGFVHPHSYFLRVLYESGVLGMVSLLIIIFMVGRSLSNSRNKYCYILTVTIFCFLIVFLTESFDDMRMFFAVLTVSYHIDALIAGLTDGSSGAAYQGSGSPGAG